AAGGVDGERDKVATMSTDIDTDLVEHKLTEYWGGDAKGVCAQVTRLKGEEMYLQLTMSEAAALCDALGGFVKREAVRRRDLLKEEVAELQAVQHTIFREVADLNTELFDVPKLSVRVVEHFAPIVKRIK
ncbi:hypothetical protein RZS08_41125, partial [Arthrospira platensis SPKY1]|nr:hypothetical protein [Arthrospira platensis SPKY1]